MATAHTKNAPRKVETVPGSVRETERSSVTPKLQTAYGQKQRCQVAVTGTSMTKQQFVHECDINNIVAKYQKTGAIAHSNQHQPTYGFASSLDFQESMELVDQAQAMFKSLPSSLRQKFGNDPANYLDFVQNPDNLREMIDLGLATEIPNPAEKPSEGSTEPPETPKTND